MGKREREKKRKREKKRERGGINLEPFWWISHCRQLAAFAAAAAVGDRVSYLLDFGGKGDFPQENVQPIKISRLSLDGPSPSFLQTFSQPSRWDALSPRRGTFWEGEKYFFPLSLSELFHIFGCSKLPEGKNNQLSDFLRTSFYVSWCYFWIRFFAPDCAYLSLLSPRAAQRSLILFLSEYTDTMKFYIGKLLVLLLPNFQG